MTLDQAAPTFVGGNLAGEQLGCYRLASLVRFTLGYFRVGIEGEYPIGMAFGGAAKYRYDVHRRSR